MFQVPDRKDTDFFNPYDYEVEECPFCDKDMALTQDNHGNWMPFCEDCESQY